MHFKTCPACAAYFKGEHDDVLDEYSDHVCRPNYASTMNAFQESVWLDENLRKLGYKPVAA